MSNTIIVRLEDNQTQINTKIIGGAIGPQGPKGDPGEVTQAQLDEVVAGVTDNKLKAAKIEKELNDYQKTLSQVNINQEAKQQASGYGVVSLPPNAANGQVGAILHGNTRTNLVPQNWELGSISGSTGKDVVTTATIRTDFISIKNQTVYTADYIGEYSILMFEYDANDVFLGYKIVSPKTSIATDANTSKIRFRISTVASVDDIVNIKFIFEEGNTVGNFITGTKSTVGAMRLKSVSADETETSTAYVTAKDSEGKIALLRSVPSANDEIRVSEGKLIKRVSDKVVLNGSESWSIHSTTRDMFIMTDNSLNSKATNDNIVYCDKLTSTSYYPIIDKGISMGGIANPNRWFIKMSDYLDDLVGFKAWLQANPITLTYQLAESIEIPVQVSGNIVSHPSGTVYIDHATFVVGIYGDNMAVTHQDLPIRALNKVTKIDYQTGLEYELDVSKAVMATDGLSYTHPDLQSGDIVFFDYDYDVESTEGETSIEFYDSRYVRKDSVTGKFYKWDIGVADGTPTIVLTEV